MIATAAPRAGFAVMPEYPSEPPHCSASISSEAGTVSRFALATAGSISRSAATPASMVRRVPPVSWMVKLRKVSLSSMP